jgi:hypothetical protein
MSQQRRRRSESPVVRISREAGDCRDTGIGVSVSAPPPYDYLGAGDREDLRPGTELWYKDILHPDPDRFRAKCYSIEIRDIFGDGASLIQAAVEDSRFCYLNEVGETVHVKLGDHWHRDYPGEEAPPLVDFWDYYRPVPPAE